MPARRLALIGSGPTALYTLAHLLDLRPDISITVFEAGKRLGVGTPYDRITNSPEMLANIASIELPPINDTLLAWAQGRSAEKLAALGLDPGAIDERTFLPRIVLGDYFEDQMRGLLARAADDGTAVSVYRDSKIVDIVAGSDGCRVVSARSGDNVRQRPFEWIVVATGHQRPRHRSGERGLLAAYEHKDNLRDIRSLGILGTSLSGIDVAISHAVTFGRFSEENGRLHFRSDDGKPRKIALMSRTGLLPEADFYCPIPYEPLTIFTSEAARESKSLDQLFEIFRRQLASDDTAYAKSVDLDASTADDFAERYFAARMAVNAFQWAEENMVEVDYNHAHRRTVAWRYSVLRMHEAFGAAIENLPPSDQRRFDRGLKKVFVDNYAAVPPLTIRRLLALRDAGVLELVRLTNEYELEPTASQWKITWPGGALTFDAVVDARGQQPLDHLEISFPTLRMQLHAISQDPQSDQAIRVDESFRLGPSGSDLSRVYFAAIPFLLQRKPFIQGLTASKEIGCIIAESVANDCSASSESPSSATISELLADLDESSLIFSASPDGMVPLTLRRVRRDH